MIHVKIDPFNKSIISPSKKEKQKNLANYFKCSEARLPISEQVTRLQY